MYILWKVETEMRLKVKEFQRMEHVRAFAESNHVVKVIESWNGNYWAVYVTSDT